MKKYAQIQKVVTHLTDDDALRTFFTLYLMAETTEERLRLNDRFHADASTLPPGDHQLLRAEITRCFLRLPAMAADLAERVMHPAS
jgi:hypothetical protein